MASSSAFPVLGHPPTDKLTRQNHPMWRAQVLPAIRGAQLIGLLDGSDAAPPETMTVEATAQDADKSAKSVPNPAYATWLARDQMVLSYLLGSISPGVMPHIMRLEHAAGVWKALETMFASHSQSKITNLRIAMATTRRLHDSVDVYLLKMQTIADELAAAGKPVPEEEQVAYIMAGLGSEYANLVESYGILPIPAATILADAVLHAMIGVTDGLMMIHNEDDLFPWDGCPSSEEEKEEDEDDSLEGYPPAKCLRMWWDDDDSDDDEEDEAPIEGYGQQRQQCR
ncbi:hypothetical protein QYE76_047397 [Lolium multiflorum]|uniref:Retrotransposon Copia-like N-terminal domain-containing protein n=1 Tax=Lolium multiflorum TaxID=4521 RepID=A0AAD8TRN7_LOLMU|nr:hypothetical protein QYE76_047397 [Lolium multiflorum]